MWILRKHHECLSQSDKEKLQLLYQHSPLLKKAHRYALKLTQIFNTHSSRKSGMAKINRWIHSVEKSDLSCFDGFITTLKKYQPYVANYFKNRRTSGFVEGLNNKIKVAKRRCYGLSKTTTIFQRLFVTPQLSNHVIAGTCPLTTDLIDSKIFQPCFRAVEIKPRIRTNIFAPSSVLKPPDIFCLHFIIRTSRSAWLLVNGTR